VLREQSPLQINTYVLTFDIDEVEVFTGSVKCFSRKMHKAPEITGQNLSKPLANEFTSLCGLIVAKKYTFFGLKNNCILNILGPYSRSYFSILQNLSKIFVVVKHWLLYRNTQEFVL
jgi:hypothetical protein